MTAIMLKTKNNRLGTMHLSSIYSMSTYRSVYDYNLRDNLQAVNKQVFKMKITIPQLRVTKD